MHICTGIALLTPKRRKREPMTGRDPTVLLVPGAPTLASALARSSPSGHPPGETSTATTVTKFKPTVRKKEP